MTRNAHVLREIAETPWAMRPQALAQLVELVAAGADEDDIHERMGVAAARPARRAGTVAVIPLQGVIRPKPSLLAMLFGAGGGGLLSFRSMLREALGDEQVTGILLDVDSPGGLVDLVPEVAAEIRAARGTKPIVAIANTFAASAAYWLASQADELVVTPSGEVGSIGVFVAHEDWSRFDERMGVTTTLIAAGKYKTEGNPLEPLSDEAREAMQAKVDEYYGMFVADVAKGRGVSEKAVRGEFGEGRMVTARTAVKLGMADRVETLEQAAMRLVRGGGHSRRAEHQQPEPAVTPPAAPVEAAPQTSESEPLLVPGAERLLARRTVRKAFEPAA